MTSTADLPTHSSIGLPSQPSSYGDSPTGSVSFRKASNSHVKKRASRAGTRSVNTLSAAQLERKRANDREAQRAIRQRTKDHIDSLEKALNDLKQTLETREKVLTATHSRNRELEDENTMLRVRLNEANISTSLPAKCMYYPHAQWQTLTEPVARATEASIASAPQSAVSEASGSISQRSNSISHGFGLNNGAMTNGMNGTWQQSGFTPANGALMLQTNNDAQARGMTGWRARDSSPTNPNLHGIHPPQIIPYTPNGSEDRSAWPNQYEFGVASQQTQHFAQQATTQQPENHYNQTQNSYQAAATPTQQQQQQQQQQVQTGFHPPLLPPQDSFSQAFYQYQPQGFPTQSQYQATPQSATGNFSTAQQTTGSATQYNPADHTFQHVHPPMQYRDDADFRGDAMAQYSSG
ncbi:hypothetical protein AMS68_002955 [Peltaster fructicola]|uniref:BZIP domain-containing protein n=1 Tax=Peltaster fructicola TaxID=286661 RepID=A0A6H0XS35_9PEZI|nr:hypothetical protein AMS68_002955 [Peltaster fructicola]